MHNFIATLKTKALSTVVRSQYALTTKKGGLDSIIVTGGLLIICAIILVALYNSALPFRTTVTNILTTINGWFSQITP